MSWRSEWRAISDRIQGFLDANRFYLESKRIRSDDPYRVAKKLLLPQAQNIFRDLTQFNSTHPGSLPGAARECLQDFLNSTHQMFFDDKLDDQASVQFSTTALASLRSEFSYHISDFSAVAKRLSERAFQHLQRTIVANPVEKDRWCEAFQKGELACEKIGATHLLLHGIWAFKVDAKGERTDLVFSEPLRELVEVESSAEALVLTEWKIARKDSELDKKVNAAEKQAAKYTVGSLGGLELAQYRYIVIVSEKKLQMPPDDQRDGVIYRHINIAVNPDPPSKS